ncbi:MAG: hypothetical protein JSW05_03675 [Candidatus Thorarchaeota archaeon]|nr:MAG: hypothetical protein JSW05_03675 [Candidatus Thorarchaeota archaeon]
MCIDKTVNTQIPSITIEPSKTLCGRPGCITLYIGDDCVLCDAAIQILKEVVGDFGLSDSTITLIDAESLGGNRRGSSGSLVLPTINICRSVIKGLPDVDAVRGAIMHAVLRNCFFD